jgi:hypothetical protein
VEALPHYTFPEQIKSAKFTIYEDIQDSSHGVLDSNVLQNSFAKKEKIKKKTKKTVLNRCSFQMKKKKKKNNRKNAR